MGLVIGMSAWAQGVAASVSTGTPVDTVTRATAAEKDASRANKGTEASRAKAAGEESKKLLIEQVVNLCREACESQVAEFCAESSTSDESTPGSSSCGGACVAQFYSPDGFLPGTTPAGIGRNFARQLKSEYELALCGEKKWEPTEKVEHRVKTKDVTKRDRLPLCSVHSNPFGVSGVERSCEVYVIPGFNEEGAVYGSALLFGALAAAPIVEVVALIPIKASVAKTATVISTTAATMPQKVEAGIEQAAEAASRLFGSTLKTVQSLF